MRVRDIMSRPVHTVRTTDPIECATAELIDKKITAAPVVDDAGKLVGIVSESDLLLDRVPAEHPTLAGRGTGERPKTVADVMTDTVVTGWPDEDVAEVAQTMLTYDVRSVPVLDDGVLVGIISRHDILKAVVRTDEMVCHEVQHRLDEYAGGTRRWAATVVDGAVTIDGDFDDEVERTIVLVMARTVPGAAEVRMANPRR